MKELSKLPTNKQLNSSFEGKVRFNHSTSLEKLEVNVLSFSQKRIFHGWYRHFFFILIAWILEFQPKISFNKHSKANYWMKIHFNNFWSKTNNSNKVSPKFIKKPKRKRFFLRKFNIFCSRAWIFVRKSQTSFKNHTFRL